MKGFVATTLGGNHLPIRLYDKNRCHGLYKKMRQVTKILQHPEITPEEAHLYDFARALRSLRDRSY